VNFTRQEIMKGQFDPQEMIDQMVAVIGADDGKYRHAWPTRRTRPSVGPAFDGTGDTSRQSK
jgi:hypothetical protein